MIQSLQNIDIADYLSLNDTDLKNSTYSFDSSTNEITLSFDYEKDLQGNTLQLDFRVSQIPSIVLSRAEGIQIAFTVSTGIILPSYSYS